MYVYCPFSNTLDKKLWLKPCFTASSVIGTRVEKFGRTRRFYDQKLLSHHL
jgi:hypothetical protein